MTTLNIAGSKLERINIATAFDQYWLEHGNFRDENESLEVYKTRVMKRLGNILNASEEGLRNYFNIEFGGDQFTFGYVTDATFSITENNGALEVSYNGQDETLEMYNNYRFLTFQDLFDAFNFTIPVEDKDGNAINVASEADFLATPLVYLLGKETIGTETYEPVVGANIHILPHPPTAVFVPKNTPAFITEVFTDPQAGGEFRIIEAESKIVTYTPTTTEDSFYYTFNKIPFEIKLADIVIFDVNQNFADYFLFENDGNVTPFGFEILPKLFENNAYWGP